MNNNKYSKKVEKLVKNRFNKLSLIITSFCVLFGTSFGVFVVTTQGYKASEMYVGDLLYSMDINVIENENAVENTTVTVPNEYTYTAMINIQSLNPVRSKYKLQYSTACTSCMVFISDVSGWDTQGFINAQDDEINNKTMKIIIINTSGSAATINFAVTGGYSYNSLNSISVTEGYTELFRDDYVDLSLNSKLTDIVKDDTECTPTAENPCLYGGEVKRNYITNNEKIYRMLGVYLIDNIEYVKMIQIETEPKTNYSSLATTYTNYYSTLHSSKTNYLTGAVEAISKNDYVQIGGLDSYLNDGNGMITSTLSNSNVYYVSQKGELKLITQTDMVPFKPVLTLKTDARKKNVGVGSKSNPYIISSSLSDIIINNITVNGTPAQNIPTSGVYTMDTSCSGGNALWKDKGYVVEYGISNSPLICDLIFVHQDMKLNIFVNGVKSSLPITGTYNMYYDCSIGNAKLSWDNTAHEMSINIISGPILCDINFVTRT